MNRTIQLDIPESLYEAVVEAAGAEGATAEEWILTNVSARLRATFKSNGAAGRRFRDSFGSIDSGNPHAADNEAIDADLAKAYGDEDRPC